VSGCEEWSKNGEILCFAVIFTYYAMLAERGVGDENVLKREVAVGQGSG